MAQYAGMHHRRKSVARLNTLLLLSFVPTVARAQKCPQLDLTTIWVEGDPYTSGLKITSTRAVKDFVPDGNLEKDVWHKAQWVCFDYDMSGQKHFPEADTRVAAVWTVEYVYFAFRCKYTTLNVYEGEDPARERWKLWERDVVEVFVNPEPKRVNHYYEFEVAPNNQWIDLEIDKDKTPFNDAQWDSHFDHATHIDAKNHVWTCEMRIPVAALGVRQMAAYTDWRINFFRDDGPGDNTRRHVMCWSPIPEGKTFHTPRRFGLIQFAK